MNTRRLRTEALLDRRSLIAPSLLASDFTNIERSLKTVAKAGCRWVHLDIMDGHFVPNLTFGPPVVKAMRPKGESLFFDTHLMISEPEKYADAFIKAGSDLVCFHLEASERPARLVSAIHEAGAYAGIAIKPNTPIDGLIPLLEHLDLVLVMTVEPGFGGQKLIPNTLSKVHKLSRLRDEKGFHYIIEVDGGIDVETAPLAAAAGAEAFVAGSAVFRPPSVKANVQALRAAIDRH